MFSYLLIRLYLFLSVAVIKHLDQGNLKKSLFGLVVPEESIMAGSHGRKHGVGRRRKQRDCIFKHKCKQNAEKKKTSGVRPLISKPVPSDIFPAARLCYLNLE